MTRDELNAITARLRARPGGVPRTVEQAITAVDAYLTLAEAHPKDTVLRHEHSRALELWALLHEALAAIPPDPTVAGQVPVWAAQAA